MNVGATAQPVVKTLLLSDLLDTTWNLKNLGDQSFAALGERHDRLARDVARGAKPIEVEGLAKPMAARIMSLAQGGQTLLTRSAFDLARRGAVDLEDRERLSWLAHGDYLLSTSTEQHRFGSA